eukprot:m.493523 g.493523  ORF g.493523 m.493523 type:complete len:422 (+) comp37300_c0_seq1:199-1464(+)
MAKPPPCSELLAAFEEREKIGGAPFTKADLCDAVGADDMEAVAFLCDRVPQRGLFPGHDHHVCLLAVRGGNADLLTLLVSKGWPLSSDAWNVAASAGQLAILRVLHANRCPRKPRRMSPLVSAAAHGHPDTVKFLIQHVGLELTEYVATAAARHANLDMLMFLVSEGCPLSPTALCDAISANTNVIPTVKFLLAHGCPSNTEACQAAARTGNLQALKLLVFHGCGVDAMCLNAAAEKGHLPLIAFLRGAKCPVDEDNVSFWPCANGNLEVLRYLVEAWGKRVIHEDAVSLAAHGGHLELIKYVHKMGSSLTGRAVRVAAFGGHLDVLRFFHDNGVVFNEDAMAAAAESGHVSVLSYLRDLGCPMNTDACLRAIDRRQLDALKFLTQAGCPLSSDCLDLRPSSPIRQHLLKSGCPKPKWMLP